MKFLKSKLVAALSLTLLLSTQTKPMGHDAELVLQAPMANQLPVEVGTPVIEIKTPSAPVAGPSLMDQAREAFSKNAGKAVNAGKSLYGTVSENKAISASLAVGLGAGVYAYKKGSKKAAITSGVAGLVAGSIATAQYKPELVQAGKEMAVKAGKSVVNTVTPYAQTAAGYVVDASKSVANYVVANTPDLVKDYPLPAAIVGGAAVYGAYKAYAPVKAGVKKAGDVVATKAGQAVEAVKPYTGKIAVAGLFAGAAGVIAYDAVQENKEVIVELAKNAVSAVVNAGPAIKNADYAKYGHKVVDVTVKPVAKFVVNQASKLKINGARLVNAALNYDYKAMAKNTGEYITGHKAVVGSVVAVPTVLAAGYVGDNYVMPNLSSIAERRKTAKLQKAIARGETSDSLKQMCKEGSVAVNNPAEVIAVDAITTIVDLTPVKAQLPVKVIARKEVEQTILPGQDKAKRTSSPSRMIIPELETPEFLA